MAVPSISYLPHAIMAAVSGCLIWLTKWLGNKLVERVQKGLEQLDRIEKLASNHLEHIQESTAKTRELVEVMVREQAETNGFLKAWIQTKTSSDS